MGRMLALVVLFLTVPYGQPQPQKTKFVANGFLKAHDFLDLDESQRTAFAMGFVDGLFVAPLLEAPDDSKLYNAFRTCMADMTNTQIAAIIEKHVRDNPEIWHHDLEMEAFNALLKACHAESAVGKG